LLTPAAERLAHIHAVLLDMDGTLVDSDAAVERAWLRWAAEYGVDPASIVPIMHGSPASVTVSRVAPHLTEAEVVAAAGRQLELQYDDVADVVPIRGAAELIEVVRQLGLPWAVVTSADRRLAQARLAAAEITPPVLVALEDVAVGKPDPEGFLAAAHRLGVPIDRCLVVEDSEPGIEAGRRAGALVAGLRSLPADISASGLAEIAALLRDRSESLLGLTG
jgi:sugar-phosphatase